jgi:hypothetical protein
VIERLKKGLLRREKKLNLILLRFIYSIICLKNLYR